MKSILDKSKYTQFGICTPDLGNIELKIELPEQIRDEIPTLNRTGYMKLEQDEYSKQFIEEKVKSDDVVMEIGPAYGLVIKQVLNKGCKVIAADLSEEHLLYILQNTPLDKRQDLYLYQGEFPLGIDLPDETIKSILISRVMHFLDGKQFAFGLKKLNDWLVPGGKLYFTAVSPYNKVYKDKFLETYKARVEDGYEWPGLIENQWELAPEHKPYVNPLIHLFDIPHLEQLLPEYGFQIEQISLFDYSTDRTSENKGHIGFVATKVKRG